MIENWLSGYSNKYRMYLHFQVYAYQHGTPADKQLSHFININMAKSVLICNVALLLGYFAMFKTYRNS